MGSNGAWLVDERWLKAYPITTTLSIGRGPENSVILRDPAVSRLHATVTGEADGYLLRSFGQSGVAVNGTPAAGECRLHEGDRIEIASSRLRFTCQEPDDEMIVLPSDSPVSLDRLAPVTRSFPLPSLALTGGPSQARVVGLALALAAGVLLILLALR